jgi:RNA polymerase sigma-70 factor (ECF subfamily)
MTTAEDARDFEEVALPLIPDVSRFAYSLTRDPDEADDLVQDTYLKAFRAWHTFSPGTNVRSWLFTICKNTFRRRFRRERVRPEVEQEAVGDDDAMPTVLSHVNAERLGLGDLFDRLDVQPALEQGLAELPELFREIVALVDLEGLSYHEAAEILDVPVGTVRSRLFRARRRLQEHLIDQAIDMGIATGVGT